MSVRKGHRGDKFGERALLPSPILQGGGSINSQEETAKAFIDTKMDVKMKLAILWAALVFCYAYTDIISFFQPGTLEELLTGELAGIEMTQGLLFGMSILMSVSILMIVLSVLLKARVNRLVNIIVGVFHGCVLVATLLVPGDVWAYYTYFMIVEAVLIGLIVWHAWKWPEQQATTEKKGA
ncbi:MAG: hypothetical protein JSV94_05305 [Methanobacteriota archaeon]|nr:MAG: hypothetical protein JSV94_05305 [Euryarchaeota archaeon]